MLCCGLNFEMLHMAGCKRRLAQQQSGCSCPMWYNAPQYLQQFCIRVTPACVEVQPPGLETGCARHLLDEATVNTHRLVLRRNAQLLAFTSPTCDRETSVPSGPDFYRFGQATHFKLHVSYHGNDPLLELAH